MGNYDLHPLEAQPTRVLLLVRTALERSVMTAGDAAEILGTSTGEIRQLLARPGAVEGERRAQQDLEDAAFASCERGRTHPVECADRVRRPADSGSALANR
jgi:hypothetical protein